MAFLRLEMIRLVWLDRFLAFLCLVLILFIVTMGWLIGSERKLSETFAADTVQQNVRELKQPSVKPYAPAPASSNTARRMYEYRQDNHEESSHEASSDGIVNVSGSKQHDSTGYQWAASHNVRYMSDCDVLAPEYVDGCRSYIEVNHYVSTADPSLSL